MFKVELEFTPQEAAQFLSQVWIKKSMGNMSPDHSISDKVLLEVAMKLARVADKRKEDQTKKESE